MKLAVFFLVGRWRLELQTNCLKGNCSTIELASHLLSFVKVNTILQKSFCKCKHFFQKIKIPAENAFPQGLFGFLLFIFCRRQQLQSPHRRVRLFWRRLLEEAFPRRLRLLVVVQRLVVRLA